MSSGDSSEREVAGIMLGPMGMMTLEMMQMMTGMVTPKMTQTMRMMKGAGLSG